MAGACGSCTMCCKILEVTSVAEMSDESVVMVKKSANTWCRFCDIGKGCTIYNKRPPACSDFQCLWLRSQLWDENKMTRDVRPDRSKVVLDMAIDGIHVIAWVDKDAPEAWRRGQVAVIIERIARNYKPVMIIIGDRHLRMNRDGIVQEAVMSEPDAAGVRNIIGVKPWRE